MTFNSWRIGLDIQDNGVYCVALASGRHGWQMRGWWNFPALATPAVSLWAKPESIVPLLSAWRRLLPYQHFLTVSFPALHTVQRQLVSPQFSLNEPQREAYIALNIARELQLTADALRLDYRQVEGSPAHFEVTAARRALLDPMVKALGKLRLSPDALTPDACALQALLPCAGVLGCQAVVQFQNDVWLWATVQGWGAWPLAELAEASEVSEALGLPESQVAFIGGMKNTQSPCFDPWQVVARRHPPMPEEGSCFGVALALALGGR